MVAVSVVMSTYNDADCLPETLDSVLAQEMSDLELIVVNDGSTDERVSEILADYQNPVPQKIMEFAVRHYSTSRFRIALSICSIFRRRRSSPSFTS